MAEMCAMKGCPNLACMRFECAGESLPLCFDCGRKAREQRGQIEERLGHYTPDVACSHGGCSAKATHEVETFNLWSPYCRQHANDMLRKLKILNQRLQARELKVFFKKPPQARIEEIPPV